MPAAFAPAPAAGRPSGAGLPRILYACYTSRQRTGEQFVAEHVFSYQVAGTLVLTDATQTHTFPAGSWRLVRRNHLVRFDKQPPAGGEFKSLSVYFDQATLRAFAQEQGYAAQRPGATGAAVLLAAGPLFASYLVSLQPYQALAHAGNEALLTLKVREALLLLLQASPELAATLFDFAEPGKLDLAAFMEQNFRFRVGLPRLAYLTGRSLATFKRDFAKLFSTSPSRWLVQRRLQEAHYLLTARGQTPSEVYLAVGFEDLSHFSFAFKKAYGVAPSRA